MSQCRPVLNPLRDQELLSLGLSNEGVVDLGGCEQAGITEDKLRWLVSSGRWQTIYPRTFATFSGPLPYDARLQAAVLYAGAGAALSHETAGALQGLCSQPDRVHVVVRYEREVANQPGLVVHRSRTITSRDISSANPPRTNIERTVLDLLAGKRTANAALGLIGDAIRTRRTNAERLRIAVHDAPCVRWRRLVLDALPDVAAGAQSPLELRDAQLRRRHGLPLGRRQAARRGDGAEYLDVLIEPYGVHIELDGRLGHDRATERWRDMRRDNRSEIAQLRHLRYGWADVVDRPCAVAMEQALVLRQQGWEGVFVRCRACPPEEPEGL